VRDGPRAVATGGERVSGGGIEAVGVDALADRHGAPQSIRAWRKKAVSIVLTLRSPAVHSLDG
jgi:hypothetical protein